MDSSDPQLRLRPPPADKNQGPLPSTLLQGTTGCFRHLPLSNASSSNSYLKPQPSTRSVSNGTDVDYPPLTAPVAPVGASIAPFQTPKTAPVLFYDKNDPFYEFTNFSPHDVIHKGKRYPTSEHLFQAFKVRIVSYSLAGVDSVFCVSCVWFR